MNLTLARIVGLLAAVGAGISAFTAAVTTSGGYKAAAVAAFSAIVATWLHEEHATERNATTAAASLPAATAVPAVHPADAAAAAQMIGAMAGGLALKAPTGGTPAASAAPTTDASTGQPVATP